jgi:hypothetical protein
MYIPRAVYASAVLKDSTSLENTYSTRQPDKRVFFQISCFAVDIPHSSAIPIHLITILHTWISLALLKALHRPART